ncbi:MAG TPA: tetratricopeptide repeat protein, partial [Vicinamibacteria bacterium]|nr:tetratricopeptide repeat protein [Vicinamibacteria bacterium]
MALKLGQARGEDVADLIARKQYAKAIEIIKEQLRSPRSDTRVRLQLADVLVMAGRPQEAVAILVSLADEYAREGFAAKAVAVLKRIQKIDPRRRDVESRLASLIEEKQRQATVPIASTPARVEFGFEEIQPGLELGIEPLEDSSLPAEPPPVMVEPPPAPVEDHDLAFGEGAPLDLAPLDLAPEPPAPEPPPPAPEPDIVLEPEPVLEAEPVVHAEPELHLEPVVEAEPVVESLPVLEAEPILEAEITPDGGGQGPLGDDLFAQELMSVLEDAVPGPGALAAPAPPDPAAGGDGDGELCPLPEGGRQIVVSPLFRDFSVDELVAVIHGLKLLCYDAGEIIIGEGEP